MTQGFNVIATANNRDKGVNDLSSALKCRFNTVIKDPVQDQVAWKKYLETVVKERDNWSDLYRASREHL